MAVAMEVSISLAKHDAAAACIKECMTVGKKTHLFCIVLTFPPLELIAAYCISAFSRVWNAPGSAQILHRCCEVESCV
jgi:hypothetical protein